MRSLIIRFIILSGLIFTVLSVSVPAQACTPWTDAFTDNLDGTFTNTETKNTWKRCAEGQTYDGVTCSGGDISSLLTWAEASSAAQNAGFADKTDWRLPTLNELTSTANFCEFDLVYINGNRAMAQFWADTPGSLVAITSDGRTFPQTCPTCKAFVRLVRGCGLKTCQTIGPVTFSPETLPVDETTKVSATATSGLEVTFSSTTPEICSVSGNTVTGIAGGSCVIAADQEGDSTYAAATQVKQAITAKSSQSISTISFSPATLGISGAVTAIATASSGLTVSFISATPAVCSVGGSTVTGVAEGTCVITADQAGNDTYSAAPQMMQSIRIDIPPDSKDPSDNPKSNSTATGTDSNAAGICSAPSSASKDPVDLATGNYYDTLKIMEIAAAGAPLQMTLNYNSGQPVAGSVGFGWRHPFQYILSDMTTYLKITWPGGHISVYRPNGSGGYFNSSADAADVLIKNPDGSFVLTDRRQKTYTFAATGKPVSMKDRLGFVKNITYLANGNLDKVTDVMSGRFLQFGYDPQNRITSVSSAGGGTVTLAYDPNGNLATVTDALGNITSFTYDVNHRLLTKINALGATTVTNVYHAVTHKVISQDDGIPATPLEHFTYATDAGSGNPYVDYQSRTGGITRHNFDAGFKLLSTSHPLGGSETNSYAPVTGVRISYKDPLNNQSLFTYDAAGYILSRTDALGHVASYVYDAEHNIVTSTDESGNVTRMTYGPNHQLLSTTDAKGAVTGYTYNAQGLLATVTAPKGGLTSYSYDVKGQLTGKVDPAGVTTGYTYDAGGRVLTRTDGGGHVWSWTYDLAGNVLSLSDPLGNTTRNSYDAMNRVATATAPGGAITRYAYDIHDHLTSVTDALGGVTTLAYDADDRLISVTDALGRVTTLTRDAKGRITSTTDPLGHVTTKAYNAADDITAIKDAQNNQTGFTYDSLRRLRTVTDPFNKNTSLAYDAVSRVTSQTDAKGNSSSFGYDAMGQLISSTNAAGGTASQVFDTNGNRVSFSDANGNITTFTLDVANRITRIGTADGGASNYTYNSRSLIATATNGRGQVATYTYNTAGRLITLSDPAGTTTYTYDANGNILTVGDARGTSSYTYDALNRLTSYTDIFGKLIGYGYDAVGNLTTLTYPGSKIVTYVYDASNRMLSVSDWSGHVTAYTYDARGNMASITRANGTKGTYSYDAKGQISSLIETTTGNASLYRIDYTYDSNGNITSEVTTPATAAPANATGSMTYGPDNRLATSNGQAVAYDADGNMTSGPLNGVTSAYSFDARSRLIGAGGSSYVYDAQGNRVSATNAGVVTRYLVDPNTALPRMLMETDAAGTPIAYYVYGLGLISRTSATGTYQTYHYDLRGSTLKLTDATGTVTDSYRYGPYGELVSTTGQSANPFRYNGRDGVMTESNGLYYMRARFYLPEAKRFVSRDTLLGNIEQALTLNRFAYVNGNPVGFVDPSGNASALANLLLFASGAGLIVTAPVAVPVVAVTGIVVGVMAIDTSLNGLIGNILKGVLGSGDVHASEMPLQPRNNTLVNTMAHEPACQGKYCINSERTVLNADESLLTKAKRWLRENAIEIPTDKSICPDNGLYKKSPKLVPIGGIRG